MKEYTNNPQHINTSKKVYEIIINIYGGLKLKKTQIIFNSMIFFHKYYLYYLINNNSIIDVNNKDFSLLCISCFLLGTKSSDILMRIDDILDSIYKNKILIIDKNSIEHQKKKIFYYEFEILQLIKFDIKSYDLTYKYFSFIFEQINNIFKIKTEESEIKKIKEFLMAQIRYSFVIPLFLKFNTLTIVLSGINNLLKKFLINLKIEQIKHIIKEYEVTQEDIDNCCYLIEFFLMPKKSKINNDNKLINMDVIKNINLANSDSIKTFPSDIYNENK